MITIINKRNGNKAKFKNYRKLYDHIEHNQRVKKYNNSYQPIGDWFFDRHSYHRVLAFHDFICMQKEKAKETPGWENSKFDVLEMSYDKFMHPVIIPITPDIDIESHLEDWCRKYCEFHGFKLVEVKENDGILRVKKERADIANIGVTYNVWWR
jgi:hypothetical protein